ncbi:recombinase family protein [Klebsiella pneumoniae]|uniref:recombinase family protein n=1 Tax=Klebsiella pneumoniae TaxID=573 RepID=UPI0029FF2F0A|nr:recombinase family protein [Klebsiella pneumoniae]
MTCLFAPSLTKSRQASAEKYQQAVRPIVEELLTFGYGYQALSNVLNARGIFTPQGKPFNKENVRYLLSVLELSTANQ